MVENGYKLQKNGDGTWSVIDAFKGNPITFEGRLQIALNEEEAQRVFDCLNRQNLERHPEHGSGRLP
ncbi:hypothetical protein FHW72_002115 [Ochrobactrum sp. RC6B]|nr:MULTISPECIES: hypothetical protein [Brucella/Ochrobactrum group]KAB2668472.1 hypothetical protein F9K77_19370 [Ochrobactrum sp. LMG 5442]MBA8845411.1 hypothetical protein [Ochrobactrum sp. RH1CCR137]MBA8857061.1 hypothetical protein [Ochrobactrum sp. RH1CCR134]MBB3217033.1 hypothetical protein [Ochrobactrum sp. RC6B]MCO7737756.1 hypothetical protein [Brucella intermedia]